MAVACGRPAAAAPRAPRLGCTCGPAVLSRQPRTRSACATGRCQPPGQPEAQKRPAMWGPLCHQPSSSLAARPARQGGGGEAQGHQWQQYGASCATTGALPWTAEVMLVHASTADCTATHHRGATGQQRIARPAPAHLWRARRHLHTHGDAAIHCEPRVCRNLKGQPRILGGINGASRKKELQTSARLRVESGGHTAAGSRACEVG